MFVTFSLDTLMRSRVTVFKRATETILFVHCPKTGGSSVEAAALKRGWREFYSVRGVDFSKDDALKLSPQHMHVELLQYFFNLSSFSSIFMIARNPFSRIKSEYYWQRGKREHIESPRIWLERMFDEYNVSKYSYDYHIRPQIEFDVDMPNSRWYKLENNGVKRAVEEMFGKEEFRFLRRDVRMKVSRKDPYVEQEFDRSADMIHRFYRKDYDYFRYPRK